MYQARVHGMEQINNLVYFDSNSDKDDENKKQNFPWYYLKKLPQSHCVSLVAMACCDLSRVTSNEAIVTMSGTTPFLPSYALAFDQRYVVVDI